MSCMGLYLHTMDVYLHTMDVYLDMISKYLISENILLNGLKSSYIDNVFIASFYILSYVILIYKIVKTGSTNLNHVFIIYLSNINIIIFLTQY